MTSKELILKHFHKPKSYNLSKEEWEQALSHALDTGGCDWLVILQDEMNPIPAQAIKDLCKKIEELEREKKDVI